MNLASQQLCTLLYNTRFSFSNERDVQNGVELLLVKNLQSYIREAILTSNDRIDFLLEPGLGIEIKVDGSLSSVTRQLWRYSKLESITELILVTTKLQHTQLPADINGKPLSIVHLLNSMF